MRPKDKRLLTIDAALQRRVDQYRNLQASVVAIHVAELDYQAARRSDVPESVQADPSSASLCYMQASHIRCH